MQPVLTVQGLTYHFCSTSCLEKFRRTPQKFVSQSSPELHRDPVCGMDVSAQTAAGVEQRDGGTYYFCSKSCQERFRQNPHEFLTTLARSSSSPAPQPGVEYTCPMDPEVRQTGPGTCPKCGMALEPATPSVPQPRVEYTCPMHPEIIRAEPGSCPICGMALEPREVTGEEVNPELADMSRRFWISAALTLPILLLMISEMIPSDPIKQWLGPGPRCGFSSLSLRPWCSGVGGHSLNAAGFR